VALIGASIGRAWNLPVLPERMNDCTYCFEYIHGGGWDKTARLREVLSRRDGKPDVIVIKQCAAYFPGDLQLYRKLLQQWITDCRQAGTIPKPCTVVPVTRSHSYKSVVSSVIKCRYPLTDKNPFRHRRNRSLLEYNDWLKSFCEMRGLSCLDLEAAVRVSDQTRYLRRSLAKLDGLHLKRGAYRLLDRRLIAALNRCVQKGRTCAGNG
jgi:hypothetical protein